MEETGFDLLQKPAIIGELMENKDEELVPTFEMVSCPSISLAELKENMRNGENGKTEIIDLVSGKKITVKEMYENFLETLAHIDERDLK